MSYSSSAQTATLDNTPSSLESVVKKDIVLPWARLYSVILFMESVDLHDDTFTLGRSEKCNVTIIKSKFPRNKSQNISKVQFTITRACAGTAYICDNSKNGTFVNGKLIGKGNKHVLQNNDEIAIGYKNLTVYLYKTVESEDDKYLPLELKNKYVISRLLGQGACGEVRLVLEKTTCKRFAVKRIKKGKNAISQKHRLNHPSRIESEINILKSLSHPLIVCMKEIVDTDEYVFMILDYMEGGELTDRILSVDAFPEDVVKFLFLQMAKAVQYLHNQGITHRDLKPENVLLLTEAPKTLVKISDFGLSKVVSEETVMQTICGTPYYVAPEIWDSAAATYDQKVDVWSLGVILYYMLARELPFKHDDREILRKHILNGKYDMDSEAWKTVSEDAKDLVRKMMAVNPEERISIDGILSHSWISDDLQVQYEVARLMQAAIADQDAQSVGSDNGEPPVKRSRYEDCEMTGSVLG